MKKYAIIILIIIILPLAGIFLPTGKSKVFVVEKGEGSKKIALSLEKEGLIWWGPLFRLYALLTGVSENLQAGTYQIPSLMNIPKIIEMFAAGDVLKEEITIIEGWNLRDIGWYFEGKGMFMAEELFELVGFPAFDYSKSSGTPSNPKDFSGDYEFLEDKPELLSLEGYLFPDTYQTAKGESLEEIARKMLDNFGKKMTPNLLREIKGQNKTIFEVITLASLLEKEVITKEEKEIVAGILLKRMEAGIPLQVDATITYITGKKSIKISKEETQINSPYNTYLYLGLPLGPICNPGLGSIEAALNPAESEYWYYLSTLEGETIFSKTLEEHNEAKLKYLK
ncbi:MAG: endolytic transglycosylase MltG [Candidatus Nealsonbacteria bacterium]